MKRFVRSVAALVLILTMLVSAASALTVEQALEILDESYYYEIPAKAYEAEDLETLFSLLGDPFTYYMSEEDYQSFLDSVENTVSVVGIGVSIQYTDKGILVVDPLVGGSAYEAGLKTGDLIVAVDGISCVPGTESHRALILGEEGTEVTVTILRDGETFDCVLERREVVIPNTTFTVKDDHIGYIDCSSFGSDTGTLFLSGVESNNDSVDCWLVDLRSNSGGYSSAAVDALGSLVGAGVHLYLRTNDSMLYGYTYRTKALSSHPVVVLVNRYSASAAEAFAAGVRDLEAGISVGSRTYGKGSAQIVCDETTHPNYFSEDALKLTAYRFYSTGGITNDKIGVIPTLVVQDDMAEAVALALCGGSRTDVNDQLFLEIGGSLLHIDLKTVEEDVLETLFEALPPNARLWLYEGDVAVDYTVTRAAKRLGIVYQSRWFEDVSDSSFKQQINTLATYGLICGNEDGNFAPTETMTRGEACAMIAEALGIGGAVESYFSDVAVDDLFASSINSLAYAGLVKGVGDGTFHPEKLMTRQEYCVLLDRVLRSLNLSYVQAGDAVTEDELQTAETMGFCAWAQESAAVLDTVNALCFSDSSADPAGAIIREEAAAILYAVLFSAGILN